MRAALRAGFLPGFVTVALAMALALMLVACGAAGRPAASGPSASPAQATATATATRVPSASAGNVTLAAGKPRYAYAEAIVVTVHNGLATPIFAASNQTSCTPVQLERAAGGSWQPAGLCAGGLPHPFQVVIAPGASLPASLAPTQQSNADSTPPPTGTYRAELTYTTDASQPLAHGTTVYSAAFEIV